MKTLTYDTTNNALRHVRLEAGYTLRTWDTPNRAPTGQWYIGYEFCGPDGTVIFTGEDCGVSPMHAVDSDDALRGLLVFLTLQPGDTDTEYFADYTEAQMAFAESTDCEWLQALTDEEAPATFEDIE